MSKKGAPSSAVAPSATLVAVAAGNSGALASDTAVVLVAATLGCLGLVALLAIAHVCFVIACSIAAMVWFGWQVGFIEACMINLVAGFSVLFPPLKIGLAISKMTLDPGRLHLFLAIHHNMHAYNTLMAH